MVNRQQNGWFDVMFDTQMMCVEAASVMWLRTLRIMGGGRAGEYEAIRMVTEKVEAGAELAFALARQPSDDPEAIARKAVSFYGRKVTANRRRLAKR